MKNDSNSPGAAPAAEGFPPEIWVYSEVQTVGLAVSRREVPRAVKYILPLPGAGSRDGKRFPDAIYLDWNTRRWYLPEEADEHGPIRNHGMRYVAAGAGSDIREAVSAAVLAFATGGPELSWTVERILSLARSAPEPKATGQDPLPPPLPDTSGDLEWIVRSLEVLAKPLSENETGEARREGLCQFINHLRARLRSPQQASTSLRDCTCLGSCKGKEGLSRGWKCALESEAQYHARWAGQAGKGGAA